MAACVCTCKKSFEFQELARRRQRALTVRRYLNLAFSAGSQSYENGRNVLAGGLGGTPIGERSHDFDIDDRVVIASFASAPFANFSVEGQKVERNGAVFGAGITFQARVGISARPGSSRRCAGTWRRPDTSYRVICAEHSP